MSVYAPEVDDRGGAGGQPSDHPLPKREVGKILGVTEPRNPLNADLDVFDLAGVDDQQMLRNLAGIEGTEVVDE